MYTIAVPVVLVTTGDTAQPTTDFGPQITGFGSWRQRWSIGRYSEMDQVFEYNVDEGPYGFLQVISDKYLIRESLIVFVVN